RAGAVAGLLVAGDYRLGLYPQHVLLRHADSACAARRAPAVDRIALWPEPEQPLAADGTRHAGIFCAALAAAFRASAPAAAAHRARRARPCSLRVDGGALVAVAADQLQRAARV